MKKLLTILVAVAATLALTSLTSCKDDKKNQILDPNAKISIKAAKTPTSVISKADGYLSPVEIVRQTSNIFLYSPKYPNEAYLNFGIADEQRDLVTPKIMMWGMWVIEDGQISRDFVEGSNVIFVKRSEINPYPVTDTIAYIPDTQLRAAEVQIKAAFAAENYDEVYRLFDEAYKFTPTTGAEWLELKRQGKN